MWFSMVKTTVIEQQQGGIRWMREVYKTGDNKIVAQHLTGGRKETQTSRNGRTAG